MKQKHTICKIITLFFFGCTLALAQPHRVYVAALDESSFTRAWGKADGKLRNTIGYGATKPLSKDGSSSDEETQRLNRRVEFRITKIAY